MTYYKVIKGSEFIGVGTNSDFRKFQEAHHILLMSSRSQAQCIEIDGKLYYDPSMFISIDPALVYSEAKISEISEEEYREYKQAIEFEAEIVVEQDPISEEDLQVQPEEPETIEYVKAIKLDELRKACQNKIYEGRNVVMADSISRHFSFSFIDQMNIERLYTASLSDSEEVLPYHADGGPIRNYSKWEIKAIKQAKDQLINDCVAHYAELKTKVQAMTDISEVRGVHF